MPLWRQNAKVYIDSKARRAKGLKHAQDKMKASAQSVNDTLLSSDKYSKLETEYKNRTVKENFERLLPQLLLIINSIYVRQDAG